MKIKFVTTNAAKVALAKERLSKYNIELIQEVLNLEENRNMEVEEVAKYKASQAFKKMTEPFIIEDSAFYIESLNGFPGTFVNMAFDLLGDGRISGLISREKNKQAYAKSVLAYGNPLARELKLFVGVYKGEISEKPKGINMRGWKIVRIFMPQGYNKTLAELNDNEWQKFLDEFRQDDHFERFGKWVKSNSVL